MNSVARQSGGIALMVAVALTMSAMGLMMGSASTYDVLSRQARLQTKLSQQFWLAEAGLECAYAQLRMSGVIVYDCDMDVISIDTELIGAWITVSAKVGSVTISKTYNPADNRWVAGSWNDE